MSLNLDFSTGLITAARQVVSPNCDDRPPGLAIEAIVVHCISLPPGEYCGDAVEQFFCNRLDHAAHPYYAGLCGLRVSAHFFIRRCGELVQFVPVHRRAWHAGFSRCLDRSRANDFSIGIELEGTDDTPFTACQYSVLGALSRALIEAIPSITAERLYAHSDIAPGRKTDPGIHFDWGRYRTAVASA